MNDNELKNLWKGQHMPHAAFSIDTLRQQAKGMQRRVALRNALEYAACVVVILGFAWYMVQFPFTLMRTGSALIIAGTLVVAWQMHVRASNRPSPGAMLGQAAIDFHRDQLIRQRDALRSVWLWYVGPFVPGLVVFRWGVETELDASGPFARGMTANLVIAAVMVAIILLNRWSASKLQRRLDALQEQAQST